MKFKKLLCVNLALIIVFSSIFSVYGAKGMVPKPVFESETIAPQEKISADKEVTFIVEVEGDPVLSGEKAAELGTSYINTTDGQKKEDAILQAQGEVMADIDDSVCTSSDIEAVYTMLFNGFAVKAKYGDMEKLMAADGVKNVYVAEDIVLTPHLTSSTSVAELTTEPATEYTGRGQTIAIIDSEFDVDHDVFKTLPENPKYPTVQSMQTLLSGKTLNAKIVVSKAFVSAKIPFAFDYAGSTNGDYDLYATTNIHGTHVAGIAAGNSTTVKGTAPDAQLMLMKITSSSGALNTSKSLSALEDAVKMGVCAVNCSFGADYISPSTEKIWETSYNNARNAGVFVCVSAGNKGRGYNQKTPLTTDIDYSASGIPANLSSTMSVASASKSGTNYSQIASTSSYGVSETLELKPEITAPGASIYSSLPDNKYGYKGGTSMAAPHITGIVAVMNEYFDKNRPEVVGLERVKLIENMLMTSAVPLKYTSKDVYYSPRHQGAGGVKVASAIKSPVILTGNSQKGKISLGDNLGKTINIGFTAKNIGDADVSYDNATLIMQTDGYTTSGTKYYVSTPVKLTVDSHTLPSSLTLAKGESKNISFSVTLNSDEVDSILQIFTNGFFTDGFIRFEKSDSSLPAIGIPFTGFYGNWAKASVFDNTIYDNEASKLSTQTYLSTKVSGSQKTLGSNGNGGYDSSYIALSPNGDGKHDTLSLQFSPMRTISKLTSKVIDSAGNSKASTKTYSSIMNKFSTYTRDLNTLTSLADGDYKVQLNATFNYSTSTPVSHILEIPFYVDTKVPEIITAKVSGNNLEVTFRDNKHIAYVYTYFEDESGTVRTEKKTIASPQEGGTLVAKFDLTKIGAENASYKDIYIFVHDNAENHYVNSLSCLLGDIHPVITNFTSSTGVYSINFDILNYKGAMKPSMVLAFYSGDGMLIHAEKKDNVSLAQGKSSHSFASLADITNAKYCKLFILTDSNSIAPVETAKVFDISE